MAKLNLTGQTYGELTVLEECSGKRAPSGKNRRVWLCKCSCGNTLEVFHGSLRSGNTKSCGCKRNEFISKALIALERGSHGKVGTKIYYCWDNMKARCSNPNSIAYKDYGGRGIIYDPHWESFENFYRDMGDCPEGMSLDRINVNGNYCKENCRWADRSTQSYNTRMSDNNTSGRTGVYLADEEYGLWKAMIYINGKLTYLGCSKSYDKACKLRADAELKYYGVVKE